MNNLWTIIVKGTEPEKIREAIHDHKLDLVWMQNNKKFNSFICVVCGASDIVRDWYHESDHLHAPYPDGSVTWFGLRS